MAMPNPNKGDLLRAYLEERGVRLPVRAGWQKVSCFGPSHHRGDRVPSASVNLGKGYYKCFACDLHGDVFDLLFIEKGLTYPQALAILGGVKQPDARAEPTWI